MKQKEIKNNETYESNEKNCTLYYNTRTSPLQGNRATEQTNFERPKIL